jgi:hypothetical protein
VDLEIGIHEVAETLILSSLDGTEDIEQQSDVLLNKTLMTCVVLVRKSGNLWPAAPGRRLLFASPVSTLSAPREHRPQRQSRAAERLANQLQTT